MSGPQASERLTVITKTRGLFRIDLAELWRYRDLLAVFVNRDIKVRYRQTILGPAWLLIQPLAMTGILTAMFSGVVGLSTDGQPAPLFYLSTIVLWGYFSQVVTLISGVFLANEYLFSKIYFPRLIKPIGDAVSNAVGLGIQLVFVAIVMGIYFVRGEFTGLGWATLLAPLVILQLALFSLGVGLWIASSTARYRDLSNATPFILQAWFFLTPIVYPFSTVPEAYRPLIAILNPLAVICDLWRLSLLGVSSVSPVEVLLSMGSTLVILFGGVAVYQRAARGVADTL